jgi:hypothetical protein
MLGTAVVWRYKSNAAERFWPFTHARGIPQYQMKFSILFPVKVLDTVERISRFDTFSMCRCCWYAPIHMCVCVCVYMYCCIKALCTESVLHAIRRRYPQIYCSDNKYLLDAAQIQPSLSDFLLAMREITPTAHRSHTTHSRPLAASEKVLLGKSTEQAIAAFTHAFPTASVPKFTQAQTHDTLAAVLDSEIAQQHGVHTTSSLLEYCMYMQTHQETQAI